MNALTAAAVAVLVFLPVPNRGPAPQKNDAQKPVFRSGVELLALDVSIVDKDGRPVPGLGAGDFTVEIGGKPRSVLRAEFIDFTQAPAASAELSDVSSNQTETGAPEPRTILLLVDDASFNAAEGKSVFMRLATLVERLFPRDPLGFATLSGRGKSVEFTTDRKPVADALRALLGTRMSMSGISNVRLGLEESIEIWRGQDSTVLDQAVARECAGMRGPDLETCRNDVQNEARTIADEAERESEDTLRGLARIFEAMSALPGTKYVLFVSPGIPLGRSQERALALARTASASGVRFHAFYVERNELTDASRDRMSPFAFTDARVRADGLQLAVDASGGALHRIIGDATGAIERVRREMSALYRLGVQLEPADADGKPHSVEVKVGRPGVTTRSYRQVVAPTSTTQLTPIERLTRALQSPLVERGIGVRLATFAFRDDAVASRLVVSAEADAPAAGLKGAYVIRDRRGQPEASGEIPPNAIVAEKDSPALVVFALPAKQGDHTVKLALIDAEGRLGSAVRTVSVSGEAPNPLALGDVLIVPDGIDPTRVRPSARIAQGSKQAGVYFEVYGGQGAPARATVQVELADAPDSAALVSSKGSATLKAKGAFARAAGQLKFSPVALPPGRYFARVSIEGNATARAVRGFTIVAGTSAALLADESRALVPPFNLNAFLSPALLQAVASAISKDAGENAAVKHVADALQDGSWTEASPSTGYALADATLRGLQLLTGGQPADAEREFREALDADPEFTLALGLAGAAWAAVGRDREASRSWRTALATGIDAPFLYPQVTDALLRTGDVKGTREFLAELQEAGADTSTLERRRALAAAIAGDRRQAFAALAPWVDAHPDDQDAAFLLVLALYELKTIDKDADAAAQFDARAKQYVARGGPRQALVARWLK